ncbi:MAG: hypothetical protein HUU20_12770 [Pirellulales bacterium]|nr:hypothetical protein [Pirellulales bacterium]
MWALRKDGKLGQFGLGSLLFLTFFVALYLSAIRALVSLAPGVSVEGWTLFQAALLGLIPIAISIPFLLPMLDAILWVAVWLVKRFRKQ